MKNETRTELEGLKLDPNFMDENFMDEIDEDILENPTEDMWALYENMIEPSKSLEESIWDNHYEDDEFVSDNPSVLDEKSPIEVGSKLMVYVDEDPETGEEVTPTMVVAQDIILNGSMSLRIFEFDIERFQTGNFVNLGGTKRDYLVEVTEIVVGKRVGPAIEVKVKCDVIPTIPRVRINVKTKPRKVRKEESKVETKTFDYTENSIGVNYSSDQEVLCKLNPNSGKIIPLDSVKGVNVPMPDYLKTRLSSGKCYNIFGKITLAGKNSTIKVSNVREAISLKKKFPKPETKTFDYTKKAIGFKYSGQKLLCKINPNTGSIISPIAKKGVEVEIPKDLHNLLVDQRNYKVLGRIMVTENTATINVTKLR